MPSPARRAATAVLVPASLASSLTLAPIALAATPAPVSATQQPGGDQMTQMARQYTAALQQLHGAAFEQAFMAGMIPHHEMAVSMARMELAHGTRPELRAMAQRLITAQSQEISDMTSWLNSWYGLTPAQATARMTADIGQMMRSMQADMGSMSSDMATMRAGTSVDQAFMEAMIAHHKAAVLAADTAPGHATHSRLITLAHSIATAQNAEITQLRTWLRDWYGKSTTS
ncbi:DUF305 domain-containing protein [Streptomyces sp. MK5]|uniref:DUF305 domain-containing protein n=1 Tax=Streptomyces sp. MK5 TaxID=3064253 RepID=UPI00274083D1|nr:DUF305 domain-containing protein [Streptomyces sp. MK5]